MTTETLYTVTLTESQLADVRALFDWKIDAKKKPAPRVAGVKRAPVSKPPRLSPDRRRTVASMREGAVKEPRDRWHAPLIRAAAEATRRTPAEVLAAWGIVPVEEKESASA